MSLKLISAKPLESSEKLHETVDCNLKDLRRNTFLMFAFNKPLEFSGWLHEGLSKEHVLRFLVNETNRRTEFQFYWYYDSTCFGQPFCPSSGALSRTSELVHFCRFDYPLPPGAGRSILLLIAKGHQICKNVPISMYG